MSLSNNSYTLQLPLYTGGRPFKKDPSKITKRFWLTMNNYRNWNFRAAAKTKIDFKELIQPQILALPPMSSLYDKVQFQYTYFPPDNRRRDMTNAMAVIDKYFADALVELGKLDDDDISIVQSVSCKLGNIDKERPRMEVTISSY